MTAGTGTRSCLPQVECHKESGLYFYGALGKDPTSRRSGRGEDRG